MLTSGIASTVSQIQVATVQAGNILRRLMHTLPIKFDQDNINEALAGFEQRDLTKAQVNTNPQEGLKEQAQLAMDVKQTLWAMGDALNQLGAIELAVTDRITVLKLGQLVIQVKTNFCFDTTNNTCFNQTANTQRCAGKKGSIEHHFIEIIGGIFHAMIIKIEAVKQTPGLGRVIVRCLPFDEAAGVVTKVKIGFHAHFTADDGVQAGEYLERLAVGELEVQVRQVIPEQIHRLSGQQAQGRHWIFQNGQTESALGFSTCGAASQAFLVRP